MKHRPLALLLALTLLLSGCAGLRREKETEKAEQLLSEGVYEAYDEDGELAGYMKVSRKTLTTYDETVTERDKLKYSFDEDDGIYYLDGEEGFTVEQKGRKLWLETCDEGDRYKLTEIGELPAYGETPGNVSAPDASAEPEPIAATDPPAQVPLNSEDIYSLALPSTVDITAYLSATYLSTGTGFFDDTNGTVITNYHVIDGTYGGYITTSDGVDYDIESVIGYDEGRDIAILATTKRNSVPLTRRSGSVATGETVYALGRSLGLSWTFSDGMVSAAERDLGDGYRYIQHTAAISHGNSGGPLLDKYGNVVGINCAYISDGQNLNLAIPIADVDMVRRNANVTLQQLYNNNMGGGVTTLDTSDWYEEICIADNGGVSLYMDMPETIYDVLEVNDTQTGLYGYYTADNGAYEIYLESDIYVGDYSGITEEMLDELTNEVSEVLEDALAEYGLESIPVVVDSGYINGALWRVYAASAYNSDWELIPYLLVHIEGDTVSYLLFLSAIYFDSATEDDVQMIQNLCVDMFSSLQVA